MTDDLFNTPADEVTRLAKELSETKEAVRELSGKLGRIETRLRRVFPEAFAKSTRARKHDSTKGSDEATTLTPTTAMEFYELLVEAAKNNRFEEVRQKLSSLSHADLSFLRRELGASLGKKKPSPKALTEAIIGRIRESVMLSKHTNRQQLVEQSSPQEPEKKD
jgi:hypothetical protein